MSLKPDPYYLIQESWTEEWEKSKWEYHVTTPYLGFGYKNPHYHPREWLCYDKETAIAMWRKHGTGSVTIIFRNRDSILPRREKDFDYANPAISTPA